MLCTNGHVMPENTKFCVTCGSPIGSNDAATTQQFGSLAPKAAPSAPEFVGVPTGYSVAGAVTTSGFAIASLVLGILGISLLSIIFGFIALSQIKKRGQKGRGMAIAGIVLGFVWTALLILLIVIGLNSTSNSSSYHDGYQWGYNNAYGTSDCSWWSHGPSYDNQYQWEQGCRAGYWDNPN